MVEGEPERAEEVDDNVEHEEVFLDRLIDGTELELGDLSIAGEFYDLSL